ncbi:hypothetical protein HS088_TW10G00173 [Tripterygium wilfordii]|uniref:Uncharacterized protein n=1 Tax=Tripterygium wilfordii TaxID=458696 RepID=A0A7J7D4H9_TRIWF|nr:hypothetical protein HS088_TW10G00173 [Tripterygium wilfordii]
METAQNQRKGFMRSKLAKSFSRVTKTIKVRPTPPPTQYGPNSKDFFSAKNLPNPPLIVQKVSSAAFNDDSYGGDPNVDKKATSYILCVRERFNQRETS